MHKFIVLSLLLCLEYTLSLEIIYAINCGGDVFQDSLGIRYRRDYLTDGVASDYGKALQIKRVSDADQIIYQTERYSSETFGYSIPMPSGDGDYVLWLKFAEVWFNAPGQKVFDVTLNEVTIIKDLDIFERVGRSVAHDELFAFQVRNNKILIDGKSQPFSNEIRVEFVKTDRDNPKINAILVQKGTPDQIPQLPELEKSFEGFDEEELEDGSEREPRNFENDDSDEETTQSKIKTNKKPKYDDVEKIINPYETDESSYFIPIIVTIALFIPLIFCLCRL